MNKVKFNFNSVRDKVMNEEIEDIPVVVTYYPSLNRLNKIIIGKLYLLHIDKKVKEIFSIKPVVLFSYLVRAKIYPTRRKVDSCDKKRFLICVCLNETHTFLPL